MLPQGKPLPASTPIPQAQVLGQMLKTPVAGQATGAMKGADVVSQGTMTGGGWYPGMGDVQWVSKPGAAGPAQLPQTEFAAGLQDQMSDYFGTPAGMDPEVFEQQKAEAALGIEQGYAQQHAQLAEQLAARGMGMSGAFLTGSQALASGEALTKAKAINDLTYKQEMLTLQDEWKRLSAMAGLYGSEIDASIKMKLAEIAEQMKLAEFEHDKKLSELDVMLQMATGKVSPEKMASMQGDVGEYLETGEWPEPEPEPEPESLFSGPPGEGTFGESKWYNGQFWTWDGTQWVVGGMTG